MPKRVAEVRFENGQMGKLLMYDGLNRAIFLIRTMCYVLIVRFAPRQAKIVSNKTCSLLQEVDMSLSHVGKPGKTILHSLPISVGVRCDGMLWDATVKR